MSEPTLQSDLLAYLQDRFPEADIIEGKRAALPSGYETTDDWYSITWRAGNSESNHKYIHASIAGFVAAWKLKHARAQPQGDSQQSKSTATPR